MIITDAHYQGSVFQPIAVRVFAVGFISLISLNIKSIKNVFLLRHYSIGQSVTKT